MKTPWPFRHLGLKLLSLGLAVSLWMVVSGEETVERGLRVPLELQQFPSGMELQTDGKIVIGGKGITAPGPGFVAIRYRVDGSLDPSFGRGGRIETPLGVDGFSASALALQPDDKLIVAGVGPSSADADVRTLRFDVDGSLDASFGPGGTATTAFGVQSYAAGVAVQPDGKIVVAGTSCSIDCADTSQEDRFFVARYRVTYVSGLTLISPTRILDTRSGPLRPANSITRVTTNAPPGTTAIQVNLTTTNTTTPGYLTTDTCTRLTSGPQTHSNLNYQPGVDTANTTTVQLDPDGTFCIYTNQPAHLTGLPRRSRTVRSRSLGGLK